MLSRLVEVPTHYAAWLSDPGRSQSGLRVIDALLVASLDPAIARLLGLYYVDSSLMPGQTVDYQVVSYWERNLWPVEKLDFGSVPAETIGTGSFRSGPVQIMTLMSSSLMEPAGGLPYLNLKGSAAGLTFTLSFDRPVREIILELITPYQEASWETIQAGMDDGTLSPSDVEIVMEPTRIVLRSPTPIAFIQMETRGAATLAIHSILFRPTFEAIGEQRSLVVRLCHNDSYTLPAGEEAPLRLLPKPVQIPPLDFLRRSEVPSALNENGEVQDGRANVELVIGRLAPPDSDEIHTSQPVRLRVGYTQSSPVLNHPPTATFPRIGPLWDLIAFWSRMTRIRRMLRDPSYKGILCSP